jgi:hypothetical protein
MYLLLIYDTAWKCWILHGKFDDQDSARREAAKGSWSWQIVQGTTVEKYRHEEV